MEPKKKRNWRRYKNTEEGEKIIPPRHIMPTLLGEEKEEILRAARAKKVHDIQKNKDQNSRLRQKMGKPEGNAVTSLKCGKNSIPSQKIF